MAEIYFQRPTDQPTGALRLLDELRAGLKTSYFSDFKFAVAFAKVGPLLRLQPEIESWRSAGKELRAIFGIDEKGTSMEALEFALEHFHETHIAHMDGAFSPTFHPKLYLFNGDKNAVAFVGSNNLTVGGTETNLEMHTKIVMDLPDDGSCHAAANGLWDDCLKVSLQLDRGLLHTLVARGLVLPEASMRRTGSPGGATGGTSGTIPAFPSLLVSPPSAIPPEVAKPRRQAMGRRTPASAPAPQAVPTTLNAQALVIQIVPHHNGEVFLSKTAVDQDAAFFGWPFTGQSNPKVAANQPYPQRIPDPVVRLRVYDATSALILEHSPFGLNTVYYATKSEIRVTVPQDVVQATPSHSILVMKTASIPNYDYEMDIYVPGSAAYQVYLARCNQTMPSGGRPNPRRFGWI